LELSEHGMALNVFWSRLGRDGRRVDACTQGLDEIKAWCHKTVDQKKPSRKGQWRKLSSRPLSVRKSRQPRHQPKRARTIWLTERIASMEAPVRMMKTRDRIEPLGVGKVAAKNDLKIIGHTNVFFDPCPNVPLHVLIANPSV